MRMLAVAIVFAFMASTAAANAIESLCEAVALHATAEAEGFQFSLKKGEIIDVITQYKINKKTGVASFCSHGGGCYPAEALRLTNCTIDKSTPQYPDDTEDFYYGLDPIRSMFPPDVLRQYDVGFKLRDLGMCSACADDAAFFYVKKPASRCATQVRQALEGAQTAIEKLKDNPDYCTE